MRLDEKKQLTAELARQLDQAGTIYLTDFTGLDVKAITELRARLRAEGIRYRVVKNTLMRRALEDLDLPDIGEHLEGPTALVMSDEDPVGPARVVVEFAKDHGDRPTVKVGIVDRRAVAPDSVDTLAALPPRDQLLGAIAGGLTASVAGIVGALEALLRDIAHMIGQVAEGREEAAPETAVAEEEAPTEEPEEVTGEAEEAPADAAVADADADGGSEAEESEEED